LRAEEGGEVEEAKEAEEVEEVKESEEPLPEPG
jgi:hypothetical protein